MAKPKSGGGEMKEKGGKKQAPKEPRAFPVTKAGLRRHLRQILKKMNRSYRRPECPFPKGDQPAAKAWIKHFGKPFADYPIFK